MKLQPNQQIIVNLLSDGKFHCPTKEFFMKDDRARIAALRKLGFVFDSPRCNMGHNHSSGVVMRRLVAQNPATGKIERKMIGISGGSEKELEKQIEFHEKHIHPLFVHSSIFEL